jgi:hypothetical protein
MDSTLICQIEATPCPSFRGILSRDHRIQTIPGSRAGTLIVRAYLGQGNRKPRAWVLQNAPYRTRIRDRTSSSERGAADGAAAPILVAFH